MERTDLEREVAVAFAEYPDDCLELQSYIDDSDNFLKSNYDCISEKDQLIYLEMLKRNYPCECVTIYTNYKISDIVKICNILINTNYKEIRLSDSKMKQYKEYTPNKYENLDYEEIENLDYVLLKFNFLSLCCCNKNIEIIHIEYFEDMFFNITIVSEILKFNKSIKSLNIDCNIDNNFINLLNCFKEHPNCNNLEIGDSINEEYLIKIIDIIKTKNKRIYSWNLKSSIHYKYIIEYENLIKNWCEFPDVKVAQ